MYTLRIIPFVTFSMLFVHGLLHSQELLPVEDLEVFVKETPLEIEEDLLKLHDYLSKAGETDSLKVRSYFLWITDRIKYDSEAAETIYKNRSQPTIREILQTRKAICTGYALLFKALCRKANIPCQIINGYTKNLSTLEPKSTEQDHAWNAVNLDGKWYLLDVTWSSNIRQNPQGYPLRNTDFYFFSPPSVFILDHLPEDPMWQLLPCPITPAEFEENSMALKTIIAQKDSCFAWKDSLSLFERLDPQIQKLQTQQNAYNYNPTTKNTIELGHAYMDQFIWLSEKEDEWEKNGSIDSLLHLYPQLFSLAEKAKKYITLHDWQKENLAYTYLNYAVALSRLDVTESSKGYSIEHLQKIETNLLKAQNILQSLPTSPFIERGLSLCKEYLAIVRDI